MTGRAYARLVPKMYRRKHLPKIDRPWRPRVIAWAGPSAFYPNRFYEQDKWYKARIDKPERFPELHLIDPANHTRSLVEVISEEKATPINIGFKSNKKEVNVPKTSEETSILERKSRNMELLIETPSCEASLALYEHFGIFSDAFGKGTFFENVQDFEVSFEDFQVYHGNFISAESTQRTPQVSIGSVKSGGFNTLLMVNLDGNPFEKEGELVHWMVSNIPDGEDISKGTELASYLQPLPFNGTGYHRVVFVLFRHSQPIESLVFGSDLESRALKLSEFYKANETKITPSAISFFQTTYDKSVITQLHSMGLKSPIYSYQYNEALKPKQKEFPEKSEPFDLYMDMYRDPKDVEAEMLEERLKRAQLDDHQAPKWLDVNYNENKRNLPSWLHRRMLQREGKYKTIHTNTVRD
ncbi:unnamed protein product [Auanema sp. JU1783]|nr:unnamed protein product [Auanema sp. JU1783]